MSGTQTTRITLEDLARDLDMLVFRLELPEATDAGRRAQSRDSLRRELERIRDDLDEASNSLD